MAKKIFEQEPQEYNDKLAEALKEIPEFKMPDWAEFVKTGVGKERSPEDNDWWYKRAASILRQLYIRGVVGVGKLKTKYGGRKARGARPSKFRKGSGKIIRVILQQGETAGMVEKLGKFQFGRRLTQQGRKFLDSIEVGNKSVEVEDGKETQQEE